MKKLITKDMKLKILSAILGIFIAPIIAFAIASLNGQSDQNQSFVNDANITVTSANDTHAIGWRGILPVSRGGTGSNSFTAGSILFSDGTIITEDNPNLFWDDTNNRLGIGTTQPNSPIHVIGNALVSGNLTANKLISSTDSIINSLTIGLGGGSVDTNTAVGKYSLLNNTTGYGNTAIGVEALRDQGSAGDSTAVGYKALEYNTTGGDQNTAVGSLALRFNTTGSVNTAIGVNALRVNATHTGNTAVGAGSLISATADFNTAVGYYTLGENLTGGKNIAIGSYAGRLQTNGSYLTTPHNSVYVGAETRGLDNNDNNSIVVGYGATGAGANTAVIGNSSVSDVYFGSSSGNAKIHAANIPTISSGTSAPSSTPTALGQMYIDTSAAKVYISTGTSNSADWTIIN